MSYMPGKADEAPADTVDAAEEAAAAADEAGLLGPLGIDMPPERSRVIDYLNAAPRFLPLAGEGQVTLVQRNHVVSARSED